MTGLFICLLIRWKGGIMLMIDVYVTLIIYKRRTIDQVPESIRAAVLADLNALGFDGYGDPLQV